jgi:undecaprenyl phosphate N,N'-diacetylbacillosamine 1-phosphate transferase
MYNKYIKRFFDIVLALIILPLFGVLFIVIAPIIYLEDKGPIFYNAKRIGQNGRLFKMFKFRSMKVNAPDIRLEDGSTFNSDDDPRVTRIGKFMRETSIDEIPQILNVLIGDMSFIGPRPDPPDWLDRYSDEVRVFLKVKPGISGYSQAYFRNSVDGQEKMKNDVYYALNIDFILDVKIFFKTIWNVFKRENMYKPIETFKSKNGLDI